MEASLQNGHYLEESEVIDLIKKILEPKIIDQDTSSNNNSRFVKVTPFLKRFFQIGQPIKSPEIAVLSKALDEGSVDQCLAAMEVLEAMTEAKIIPREIVELLLKTIKNKRTQIGYSSSIFILKNINKKISDYDFDALSYSLSNLSNSKKDNLNILEILVSKTRPLPTEAFEKFQQIILEDVYSNPQTVTNYFETNFHSKDYQIAKILEKIFQIRNSTFINEMLQILHEAIVKNIKGQTSKKSPNFAVTIYYFILIAELKPNLKLNINDDIVLHFLSKQNFSDQFSRLLALIAKNGDTFSQATIVALGEALEWENKERCFATSALLSIAKNGQKIPDETGKSLLNRLLDNIPTEYIKQITSIFYSFFNDIQNKANEILDDNSKDNSKKIYAFTLLRSIAQKGYRLSELTIKKLIAYAVTESTRFKDLTFFNTFHATFVFEVLDLSENLELFKETKIPIDYLTRALATTSLKSIVKSEFFSTEQKAKILEDRLYRSRAALFLKDNNLSFFLNGQLHEIPLTPQEINELLPEIRTLSSISTKIWELTEPKKN